MPGDLHKMWHLRDPQGYHVEYGYSCMGYEIAGGLGVALAEPERDVIVMVGDGSYLMLSSELATAVQEGIKLVVVIVQNHGFASIGALSESLGSQRLGTRYRRRGASGRLDGDFVGVDLVANARSYGVDVIEAATTAALHDAIRTAKAADRTTVVHVVTDPFVDAPTSESWWEVPVAEVSSVESTAAAYETYQQHKRRQRTYLTPSDKGE
jgi:3D-(3,5/4)-trihydroxycyclohexane-1,2-dione acylhydrolase (decyclizing)